MDAFGAFNPELFLLHRGVEVYYAYDDGEEESLNYHYAINGEWFDVRDLDSYDKDSREAHREAIKRAIDDGEEPFDGIELDVSSDLELSPIEQCLVTAFFPEDFAVEHVHALQRQCEDDLVLQLVFENIGDADTKEQALENLNAMEATFLAALGKAKAALQP